MLFQIFDTKIGCPIIFSDKQFFIEGIPSNIIKDIGLLCVRSDIKQTWNYSPLLKDLNVEYAKLYCNGKTLDEVCPLSIKSKWNKINKKINAFYTSLKEAKTNYNEICIYDLIPENYFKTYFELKNTICRNVFSTYSKPKNYEFLVDLSKLIYEIGERKLNIEGNKYSNHILYNSNGSVHGRLTTQNGSFPILTLPKKDRHILKSKNDFFLSMDYVAAEVTTLNFLLEKEIPYGIDIHEWNAKNLFKGNVSREDAKKIFFSWLYNANFQNETFEKHYNRKKLIEKYYKDGEIINPYGRKIICDEFHATNYLIASTCSDIFLRQSIKINKYLKEQKAKSYITALIHDSIILDIYEKEKEIIKKCIDLFSKDCYNNNYMMARVEIGKDFGNMRKIS